MRCFKTKTNAHLAQLLLEFTDMEEGMKLTRRITKNGYVKLGVLLQYFNETTYPKKEIEKTLTTLVNAGLLEEQEYSEEKNDFQCKRQNYNQRTP